MAADARGRNSWDHRAVEGMRVVLPDDGGTFTDVNNG